MLGLRPLGVRRRIAGRAVTVRLELTRPSCGPIGATRRKTAPPVHRGRRRLGPGRRHRRRQRRATNVAGWGGTLSLGAKVRGIEGVIVDGACRDADEAIDLDFAVYASAAVPLTARGRIVEVGLERADPVRRLTVAPGDLVMADSSGVVFLGAAHAEEVIAAAEDIAARERAMADAVRDIGRCPKSWVPTTSDSWSEHERRHRRRPFGDCPPRLSPTPWTGSASLARRSASRHSIRSSAWRAGVHDSLSARARSTRAPSATTSTTSRRAMWSCSTTRGGVDCTVWGDILTAVAHRRGLAAR